MRVRFQQLFGIVARPGYATALSVFDGFEMVPTPECAQLMGQFGIRFRNISSGIQLYYQTLPADNSIIPLRPMPSPQVFRFLLLARDSDFSALADVQGWKADHIFLLENGAFNTTGDIEILNGPLQSPVLFRPLKWKEKVVIKPVGSILRITDKNDNPVLAYPVRPLANEEAAGTVEEILVDLDSKGEALYKVRHVYAGAPPSQNCYCSGNYRPGVLGLVSIRYQNNVAWTGIEPFQRFLLKIAARPANWYYRVFISESNRTLYPATQLKLVHTPSGGQPIIVFEVDGVADNIKGTVTFKSSVLITFPSAPMHFDLVKGVNTIVVPKLPMPNAGKLNLQAGQPVFSVILNI